jgi:hypothetical protein
MKPLPALVLIAACSQELDPLPIGLQSSFADRTMTASFAMRLPMDETSQTHTWVDSSRRGDTTFYSRGRVLTTLAVFTDSQWTVRPPIPPVPPVLLGHPNGPSNLPPDSLCTLGYTASTLAIVPARAVGDLQRTHDCRARTFAQIRRAKLKDSTGSLSVRATRAELDTWPWAGLCSRVGDSTIIAFYIGDDVTAAEWGPAPLKTRLAQWDSIGGLIRARCPRAAVVLRTTPVQMEARSNWQWVTTAWAQYAGPRRHGPPEQFYATQVASAKTQRLGLVGGLNLLNGGCGSATTCLPDVPGNPLPGTQPNLYQVSAAEFVYYKTVAMTDPYMCASVDWSWGPIFDSDFHKRPEIRSAAKTLAVVAKRRPLTSCIQR